MGPTTQLVLSILQAAGERGVSARELEDAGISPTRHINELERAGYVLDRQMIHYSGEVHARTMAWTLLVDKQPVSQGEQLLLA